MAYEHPIQRYRRWYARLLRLYSRSYYERFGESMEQTFADLLQERAEDDRGLLGCAIWMFLETAAAAVRENGIPNRNVVRIVLVTASILTVPLIAMQFTDEVVWDLTDFAVAGGLLLGAGLTFERVARIGGTGAYRAAVGVAVATGLLLVWMNLAVGIIGNEENPANLMFGGVLAVASIGALVARFQPHRMARAMYATAAAQMAVGMIAWIAGLGFTLILNGSFAALWLGSGVLFRRAALSSPELDRVIAAWSTLPEDARERILAIVKAD